MTATLMLIEAGGDRERKISRAKKNPHSCSSLGVSANVNQRKTEQALVPSIPLAFYILPATATFSAT